MRYLALATDYDGTLAWHGFVDQATVEALGQVSASGRKLIMVTGRELRHLLAVFPEAASFDRIVAENGAVLHRPKTGETRLLAEAPPPQFVEELRRRKVEPFSAGLVVVASEQPAETAIIEVIRDLGLELKVIFNKGSIMVLPPSVNKATGLRAALDDMQLSPDNVVGVGDAENDLDFLAICGCAVAVGNALDSVKEAVDYVVEGRAGAGVRELIKRLLADDLAGIGSGRFHAKPS
ncbi:MAG: Cof-type HAD-IIB family hydrolase [Candidatus Dormibacteraeota bacterium]|nr:Cof-type HAD-IIB family hydrolase [Candidatus Dormibacteraeota bacterium]